MAETNLSDDVDVMEYFESEDDALLAKELLDRYKMESEGDVNDTLYENTSVVPSGNEYVDSIDDGGGFGSRLTPRQVDTRYLLETEDDIPPAIKRSYWLLGSRHNELLNIHDKRQYSKYARENRDVVRTTGWQREHRKIAYSDVIQIEHYANRMLTKSWMHEERMLHSMMITRSQHEDISEPLPQTDSHGATQVAGGLIGRLGRAFR